MRNTILRLITLIALLPALLRAQAINAGGSINPGPIQQPVTKLIAGTGISLSPTTGIGIVTVTGTGGPPTGAAGGVLTGTYPNPGLAVTQMINTITSATGQPLTLGALDGNNNVILTPSGTGWTSLGAVGSATGQPVVKAIVYGTGGGGHTTTAALSLMRTDTSSISGRLEFRGNSGTAGAGWSLKTDSGVANAIGFQYVASGAFTNANLFTITNGGNVLLNGLGTDGTGVLQFPVATTSAGGWSMGTDVFGYRTGANSYALATTGSGTFQTISGTNALNFYLYESGSTLTGAITSNGGSVTLRSVTGSLALYSNNTAALTLDTSQNAQLVGKFTTYANVAVEGQGVTSIRKATRVTAQSAANSSIATYTTPAADGSYEVSANMNVTASTSLVTTLTCTYTDESNTARTMVFPVAQLSGSFIAAGAITGTGAWETPVLHIRTKASTAITILTSTGTFTGVTYTAEGIIRQLQ